MKRFMQIGWAACLIANITSWSVHWGLVAYAENPLDESIQQNLMFWIPLAGFLSIYSLLGFMKETKAIEENNIDKDQHHNT